MIRMSSGSFEWTTSSPVDYRSIAERLERQLMPKLGASGDLDVGRLRASSFSSGGLSGIVSADYVNAQSEIERVLIRNVNEVSPHENKIERISEIPGLVQRLIDELETARRSLRVATDKLVEAEVSAVSSSPSKRMALEIQERDDLLKTASNEIERLSRRLHEARAQDEEQMLKMESDLEFEKREKDHFASLIKAREQKIGALEYSLDEMRSKSHKLEGLLESVEKKLGLKSDECVRLEKNLEIFQTRIDVLERHIAEVESARSEKDELVESLHNRLKESDSVIASLKNRSEKEAKHVETLQNRLKESESVIARLDGENNRLTARISENEICLDRFKRAAESSQKDILRMSDLMAQAQLEIETLRKENRNLNREIQIKSNELDQVKQSMNASLVEAVEKESVLQKDLERFNRELEFLRMDSDHAVRALQADLIRSEKRASEAEAKIVSLQDDLAIAEFQKKSSELEDWEDERVEMEAEIIFLRTNLGEVVKEVTELKNLLREDHRRNRSSELETARKQLASVQEEYDSLKKRFEDAEEQLNSRDERVDLAVKEQHELEDLLETAKTQLNGSLTPSDPAALEELTCLVQEAKWPLPSNANSFTLAAFVRKTVLAMMQYFDQQFKDMDSDIEYLRSQLESERMLQEDSILRVSKRIEVVSCELALETSRRKSIQKSAAELCNKTAALWDKFHSAATNNQSLALLPPSRSYN